MIRMRSGGFTESMSMISDQGDKSNRWFIGPLRRAILMTKVDRGCPQNDRDQSGFGRDTGSPHATEAQLEVPATCNRLVMGSSPMCGFSGLVSIFRYLHIPIHHRSGPLSLLVTKVTRLLEAERQERQAEITSKLLLSITVIHSMTRRQLACGKVLRDPGSPTVRGSTYYKKDLFLLDSGSKKVLDVNRFA